VITFHYIPYKHTLVVHIHGVSKVDYTRMVCDSHERP